MQKILVADDSASIRMMLANTLTSAGFEVKASEDGQIALNCAEDFGPDLVITDLNMPNLNGIELVRALRLKPSFKFTPILVLTTEGQDENKQAGRQAGATGWMVKPFKPDRLVAIVKKVLKDF